MVKMFGSLVQRLGRRFVAVALVGASALAMGVLAPTSANAATAWPSHASYTWANYNGGWTNMRSCPSTACGVVVSLYGWQPVYMLCYTDSQWAFGNYWTNRWFYVYAPWANRYGYINASLVYEQAPSP
ncbi:MAG: hypothetical protein QOJ29_790, partial [Thermoleophilaceae bacterium]|nr:hypothetical protein [Thermoleophilaceae bacterium]